MLAKWLSKILTENKLPNHITPEGNIKVHVEPGQTYMFIIFHVAVVSVTWYAMDNEYRYANPAFPGNMMRDIKQKRKEKDIDERLVIQ